MIRFNSWIQVLEVGLSAPAEATRRSELQEDGAILERNTAHKPSRGLIGCFGEHRSDGCSQRNGKVWVPTAGHVPPVLGACS